MLVDSTFCESIRKIMHCTERHQPTNFQKLSQLWNFSVVFTSVMEKDRFLLCCFLIIVSLVHYPFQLYCVFSQKNEYLSSLAALSTSIVSLTLEAVALAVGWLVCFQSVSSLQISTMSVLNTIFVISLAAFLGLNFIFLVIHNSSYSVDVLLEFLTIPVIAVVITKPSFSVQLSACLTTLSVLVFAAGWSRTMESVVIVVIYFLSSCLFIINDSLAVEVDRKEDIEAPAASPDFDNLQMKAMEIRDMIGHVAHDLKTVRIVLRCLVWLLIVTVFLATHIVYDGH
jgi:hypothetical protein